jgi:O-antigen/teichoic acid export membrane protein
MSVSTNKLRPSTLRNLSTVSLHKAAQIVGQIVAVLTIPRLLGATDHGHFTFVLSFGYLWQILGDFGTLEVMTRFVPALDQLETKRLYTRTVIFKIIIGFLLGLLASLTALLLAPWMQLTWAIYIGLGVMAHIVAWVPFQFMLSVNQVGMWMIEQSWRQWAVVLLLILLYPMLGVGGSILAWTLMELLFCGLGLWWTRAYWQPSEWRFDWVYMRPYVRAGAGFFLANLIAALLYRSSPVLVETMGSRPAEVGFISLAIGLFMLPYLMLTQFALSLVPALSEFQAQGRDDKLSQWTRDFVFYSWLIGWLGVIAVWLTADWGVPFVFGVDYLPAVAVFKWISFGIPLAGLLWAGNALATVVGRGRVRFISSLVALGVFMVLTFWLVPLYAAAGAALALSLSIVANVAVLIIALQPVFSLEWPMLLVSGSAVAVILWTIETYALSVGHWGLF